MDVNFNCVVNFYADDSGFVPVYFKVMDLTIQGDSSTKVVKDFMLYTSIYVRR